MQVQENNTQLIDTEDYKAIIAVDFDGNITSEPSYPECSIPRNGAVKFIQKLAEEGYGIVINTCREGDALYLATRYLHQNNIPYHYINCNFPHLIKFYKADCRKISADVYVDDKNAGGLLEWHEIYDFIDRKFNK